MVRLYGKPNKLIRHVHDTGNIQVDAQESVLINFWHTDTSVAASADGTDIDEGEDNEGIGLPLGSRVLKHKTKLLIEPSTIEPQSIWLSMVTLSFHDILHPAIINQEIDSSGFRGTLTPSNTSAGAAALPARFYPDKDKLKAEWTKTAIASQDIDTIRLIDYNHHFFNFKNIDLFDQKPLISNRYQRIPKKARRANPYTWHGILVVNDSQTATETIEVRLQQYLEEMQLETPPTSVY